MDPSSIKKDQEAHRELRRASSWHVPVAFGVSAFIGLGVIVGLTGEAEANRVAKLSGQSAAEILSIDLPHAVDAITPAEAPLRTVIVQPGDSLAAILTREGLNAATVPAILNAGAESRELRSLKPGQTIELDVQEGSLRALNYTIDRLRTLAIRANNESGFVASIDVLVPEKRVAQATGVISSSLYASGLQAGLSETTIMDLAAIFGWDIDFALDIRSGDRFTLLYEQEYVNGQKLRDGAILAAEFVNNGRVHRAVRFTDPTGHTDYYDESGRSMRKSFLRSPVDFRRISSRFTKERYHPVLGVKRPHKGVDYAAAVGTPIKAAGDGKVIFVGSKGGYGRTIILQHGEQISTLYAHLSRFGRDINNGRRVKQGQIIGYVGQSGIATGPHLHYEFRVNGAHRNPLTAKLPNAAPLNAAYETMFQHYATSMLARIETITELQVAQSAR